MIAESGCRVCGNRGLHMVIDFGQMPLANALLTAEQLDKPEPTYALKLAFCEQCTLLQIIDTVPRETLFNQYVYLSSESTTMTHHAKCLVQQVNRQRNLQPNAFIVEAGSNDGYLLKNYHKAGMRVLGVEPARNIATIANDEHQIQTICAYFDGTVAEQIRRDYGAADVFHAHNVLAHVADLHGFVDGIRRLLQSDGIAVIEVPYVIDLLANCEFDTIYHEHLCYFSLPALKRLFSLHDLYISSMQRMPVHGGSLQLIISPQRRTCETDVDKILATEAGARLNDPQTYAHFASRVEELKLQIRTKLNEWQSQGRRIAAFGASAKGCMLLNGCGIDHRTVDYVVDQNRLKQNKYLPGCRVPIVAPQHLGQHRPDILVILSWNIATEIMTQYKWFADQGGRFVVPIPFDHA